jgi:hypothetical protein
MINHTRLILPEEHLRHCFNLNCQHAMQYYSTWNNIVSIPNTVTQSSYTINNVLSTVNTNYFNDLKNNINCDEYNISGMNHPLLLTNVSSEMRLGYMSSLLINQSNTDVSFEINYEKNGTTYSSIDIASGQSIGLLRFI